MKTSLNKLSILTLFYFSFSMVLRLMVTLYFILNDYKSEGIERGSSLLFYHKIIPIIFLLLLLMFSKMLFRLKCSLIIISGFITLILYSLLDKIILKFFTISTNQSLNMTFFFLVFSIITILSIKKLNVDKIK